MEEFAEHEFQLAVSLDGKTSKREILEDVERQTGDRPAELDGPQFPDTMEFVWGAFLDLNASRGGSGFGASPLTYADIQTWMTVLSHRLDIWEINAIRRLDITWLRVQSEAQRAKHG